MKKNLRKIPKDIQEKLKTISNKEIVVGCAGKFNSDALASGRLAHLGVTLTPQGLQLPSGVVPQENQGKYSAQNVNGLEIIRKDLPKETHYNSVESPNYGDSYKGTESLPFV
jgi:hypothetical protein